MKLDLAPGTEKWLGFAKAKLSALKARMKRARQQHGFDYFMLPGNVSVHVLVRDSIDIIRISGSDPYIGFLRFDVSMTPLYNPTFIMSDGTWSYPGPWGSRYGDQLALLEIAVNSFREKISTVTDYAITAALDTNPFRVLTDDGAGGITKYDLYTPETLGLVDGDIIAAFADVGVLNVSGFIRNDAGRLMMSGRLASDVVSTLTALGDDPESFAALLPEEQSSFTKLKNYFIGLSETLIAEFRYVYIPSAQLVPYEGVTSTSLGSIPGIVEGPDDSRHSHITPLGFGAYRVSTVSQALAAYSMPTTRVYDVLFDFTSNTYTASLLMSTTTPGGTESQEGYSYDPPNTDLSTGTLVRSAYTYTSDVMYRGVSVPYRTYTRTAFSQTLTGPTEIDGGFTLPDGHITTTYADVSVGPSLTINDGGSNEVRFGGAYLGSWYNLGGFASVGYVGYTAVFVLADNVSSLSPPGRYSYVQVGGTVPPDVREAMTLGALGLIQIYPHLDTVGTVSFYMYVFNTDSLGVIRQCLIAATSAYPSKRSYYLGISNTPELYTAEEIQAALDAALAELTIFTNDLLSTELILALPGEGTYWAVQPSMGYNS